MRILSTLIQITSGYLVVKEIAIQWHDYALITTIGILLMQIMIQNSSLSGIFGITILDYKLSTEDSYFVVYVKILSILINFIWERNVIL